MSHFRVMTRLNRVESRLESSNLMTRPFTNSGRLGWTGLGWDAEEINISVDQVRIVIRLTIYVPMKTK